MSNESGPAVSHHQSSLQHSHDLLKEIEGKFLRTFNRAGVEREDSSVILFWKDVGGIRKSLTVAIESVNESLDLCVFEVSGTALMVIDDAIVDWKAEDIGKCTAMDVESLRIKAVMLFLHLRDLQSNPEEA